MAGNRTTTLPETLTYTQNGNTLLNTAYTYDVRGNISTMTVDNVTWTYTYDSLNQLVGVTTSDNSFTASYSYDNGGNITSKTVNGVTTPYGYTDTNWKDKLTSYNGQSIICDGIGNPTDYLRDDLEWEGRLLKYFESGQRGYAYYSYNPDGVRIKKEDDEGRTTHYFVDGTTILAERTGSNVIWYIYGSDGELVGFTYNDTPYYYLKNQQGDIYKIVDANGTIVGGYEYDPWGRVLSCTGTMGPVNPIRYRGYYYDNESGFYYLNSRYYDPNTGRFLNADAFVSTGQGILGHNMFAYCLNRPTSGLDSNGKRTYFLNGIGNEEETEPPDYAGKFEDELTALGEDSVIPISLYNGQSYLAGLICGVFQVALEMLNIDWYTHTVVSKIKEDLKKNPLAEGEKITIVGYSGGGQVALNTMEAMPGQIDNVILIGAPVVETWAVDTKVHMIYSTGDLLSWNVGFGYSSYCFGDEGHTAYFSEQNIGRLAQHIYDTIK